MVEIALRQPSSARTRILLADNCAILTDTIARRLEAEPGIDCEGVVAGDPAQVSVAIRPDLVIFDPAACELDPEDVRARHLERFGDHESVALLPQSEAGLAHHCLRAEFAGVLSRGLRLEQLVSAVDAIADGGLFVDGRFGSLAEASTGLTQAGTEGLSDREKVVLFAVARGLPAKRIAVDLSISPKTVETHTYRGLAKLGLQGRAGLVSHASEHGWHV
ncbi:helix-turn-helix transcriptional regulator [Roseivivax sp. CAU 1761]